jgi:hypothetical protein
MTPKSQRNAFLGYRTSQIICSKIEQLTGKLLQSFYKHAMFFVDLPGG